jgi:hypothetical protein
MNNLGQKKTEVSKNPFFYGSIISVVGKTTVEIIELFECRQKVP